MLKFSANIMMPAFKKLITNLRYQLINPMYLSSHLYECHLFSKKNPTRLLNNKKTPQYNKRRSNVSF